ncbi:hypothetical protein, partial [uncultured Marinobacter sp.]|uniref:hypothetical protein n=1 Tax=uncultured Marinobacter sp. TaxID=187379 RepID=UPI0025929289
TTRASPTPFRLHTNRFDIKVKVTPSDTDAAGALHSALVAVYDQIKTLDKRLVIYPWKQEDATSPPIHLASEIPGRVSASKIYFNRARERANGGNLWVSIYCGHGKPFEELHEDIDWWLRANGFGWYSKTLQVENTKALGWLCYSTRTMDEETLTKAIYDAIGVVVGLRWRIISTGGKYVPNMDPALLTRALHVEVDAENAEDDHAALKRLFPTQSATAFPLNIRLRLIPELTNLAIRSKTKVGRLRARQANFTAAIQSVTTWELNQLDYQDAQLGNQTLRDLIMGIYSHEYPTLHLFHTVDVHWKGPGAGHIISFLPKLEDEARAMITGLLTYLVFHAEDMDAQDRIKLMFTPPAVERASTSTWDLANHCVVSELDTEVDELEDNPMDADYIFTDMDTVVAKASPEDSNKPAAKPSPHVGPSDNDSVSTFNPRTTKRPATSSASVASKMSAVTASERSGTMTEMSGAATERSTATTETRFSVMDRSMQSMAATHDRSMQSMATTHDRDMQAMAATHAAAQQQMERSIQVMQDNHAAAQQTARAAQAAAQAAQEATQQQMHSLNNTNVALTAALDQILARLPPPSAPPPSSLPELHPGHPDHNAMDTGLSPTTPRAGGSNAASQAG